LSNEVDEHDYYWFDNDDDDADDADDADEVVHQENKEDNNENNDNTDEDLPESRDYYFKAVVLNQLNTKYATSQQLFNKVFTQATSAADNIMPSSTYTPREAHEMLLRKFAKHSLPFPVRNEILDVIREIFPIMNFTKDLKSSGDIDGCFSYDSCLCGYTFYVDKKQHARMCTNPECSYKLRYKDERERTPLYQINYKSIILLTCNLLNYKYFFSAINIESDDRYISKATFLR
jgi:hypothetical protein